MNFAIWLKRENGFTSKAQYDSLLNTLPYESRRKTHLYYQEKFKYYLETRPKQLEFQIKKS